MDTSQTYNSASKTILANNFYTSKLRGYSLKLRSILTKQNQIDWYIAGGSVVRALIQKEIDSADIDIFTQHNPKFVAAAIEEKYGIFYGNVPCNESPRSKTNNFKYYSNRLQKNLNIINAKYFNLDMFDFNECKLYVYSKEDNVKDQGKYLDNVAKKLMTIELKGFKVWETFPYRYMKYKRMGFSFSEDAEKLFNDIMNATKNMTEPKNYPFDTMNTYLDEKTNA